MVVECIGMDTRSTLKILEERAVGVGAGTKDENFEDALERQTRSEKKEGQGVFVVEKIDC